MPQRQSRHSSSSRYGRGRFKKTSSKRKTEQSLKHLPPLEVTIDHLGAQGDGVVQADGENENRIFVPHALPGERLMVQPTRRIANGIEAEILSIMTPAVTRKPVDCMAAPACGGCQFQHAELSFYHDWKEQLAKDILAQSGIHPQQWLAPFRATPHSRRRARFAFKRLADQTVLGFRARASHHIITLDGCTILSDSILSAMDDLQNMLTSALAVGSSGELEINACDNGLDVMLVMTNPLSKDAIRQLVALATTSHVIRLSLRDGKSGSELLFQRDLPKLLWHLPSGTIREHLLFHPPAGAFLQSVSAAEQVMREDCFRALTKAERIIDLYSGSGSLGLPLAFRQNPPKKLAAYDVSHQAIMALHDMMRYQAPDLPLQLVAEARNLNADPMTAYELKHYDAAILDPPRSGAKQQMHHLVESGITHIVMVSCHLNSFVRDAEVLIKAGYQCRWARHIDQFYLTSHSECVAYFVREDAC
ncbi:MAG: class I SAM-dependent RNA methyltransferase [Candidatus Puniceispirillales bacterium]